MAVRQLPEDSVLGELASLLGQVDQVSITLALRWVAPVETN
jgi:hypothetical protein